MEIQEINVGLVANDGTGDKLRPAFIKINQNFLNVLTAVNALEAIIDEPPGTVVGGVEVYSPTKAYKPGMETYVFYVNKVYYYVSEEETTGVIPGTNALVWQETSWSKFYHVQNSDFKLTGYPGTIVSLNAGVLNLHTEAYYKKNMFTIYSGGETTREITFRGLVEGGLSFDLFRYEHQAFFYVAENDLNTYVFKETVLFRTGKGDITLKAGDWMSMNYANFAVMDGATQYAGYWYLVNTSYNTPIEGLTPEFQMTEGGLFQYKITGAATWNTIFDINSYIPSGIDAAIAHANTTHGVTNAGGFRGGQGSAAGAGAALGKSATTVKGLDVIDAIQLGTGNNEEEKSLKVYQYLLMNSDGMIPAERIGNQISRGVIVSTSPERVVSPLYMFYIGKTTLNNVTFILPSAVGVMNQLIIFAMGGQESGYAMTVERSGDDLIYWKGTGYGGITTDVNGFWFALVSDGVKYHVVMDAGILIANMIAVISE